jgi:hypothetical protein
MQSYDWSRLRPVPALAGKPTGSGGYTFDRTTLVRPAWVVDAMPRHAVENRYTMRAVHLAARDVADPRDGIGAEQAARALRHAIAEAVDGASALSSDARDHCRTLGKLLLHKKPKKRAPAAAPAPAPVVQQYVHVSADNTSVMAYQRRMAAEQNAFVLEQLVPIVENVTALIAEQGRTLDALEANVERAEHRLGESGEQLLRHLTRMRRRLNLRALSVLATALFLAVLLVF